MIIICCAVSTKEHQKESLFCTEYKKRDTGVYNDNYCYHMMFSLSEDFATIVIICLNNNVYPNVYRVRN